MGLFLSKQSTKGTKQTAPKVKLVYFSETLTLTDETVLNESRGREIPSGFSVLGMKCFGVLGSIPEVNIN
jgi:hypothetical protein